MIRSRKCNYARYYDTAERESRARKKLPAGGTHLKTDQFIRRCCAALSTPCTHSPDRQRAVCVRLFAQHALCVGRHRTASRYMLKLVISANQLGESNFHLFHYSQFQILNYYNLQTCSELYTWQSQEIYL